MKISKENKIWLKVSNACNNKCIFCLDSYNQNGSFIKFEDFKRQIDKALTKDTEKVILSGGEVTLHPDLFAMIRYLKDKKCKKIQIITNGRLLCYKDYCDNLIKSGINEITFSIHGHKEEIHDKLTGIKGSFKQAITGLKNVLRNKEIIVNIDIVLNRMNYKYLSTIILYFIKLGVYEFDILNLVPFGRAFNNHDDLFLTKDEIFKSLEKVNKIGASKKLHLWLNRFPAEISLKFDNLITNYKKIYDEVLSKEDEFVNYVKKGGKMNCAEEYRCKLCFINDFCQMLPFIVNEYDKPIIENASLNKKNLPNCFMKIIDNNVQDLNINHPLGNNEFSFDLKIFLDYYYVNLFRIKTGKCDQCLCADKCLGYPVKLLID